MTVRENLESIYRELMEALALNKPLLPVLHAAHKASIEVHFEPKDRYLTGVRLVHTGPYGTNGMTGMFDSETLQSQNV
jgi:hypothetical protein